MTLPEHYALWSRSHHLIRAALLFYVVWAHCRFSWAVWRRR